MFCSKCGTKLEKGAEFCSECGASLKSDEVKVTENQSSGSSFGWGVLGFFVPLAGLILFIMWRKERSNDSKAAGIGALISTILSIIIYIIYIVFLFNSIRNGINTGIYY